MTCLHVWYLDLIQFLSEPSSRTQAYEGVKEQSREAYDHLPEITCEANQDRVCLFSTWGQKRRPLKANTYQLSSSGFVLCLCVQMTNCSVKQGPLRDTVVSFASLLCETAWQVTKCFTVKDRLTYPRKQFANSLPFLVIMMVSQNLLLFFFLH